MEQLLRIRLFFGNYYPYILSVLIIVFSIVFFYNTTYKSSSLQKEREAVLEREGQLYRAPDSKDHYKIKNSGGKVSVVNYFSLDCIHCRQLYGLEKEFLRINTDQLQNINLVYRHNPLEIQPLSQEKALMSECVYEQLGDSGFFSFVDKVYGNYSSSLHEGNVWVKDIGEKLAPSKEMFGKCLESDHFKNILQKQKNDNLFQGINYTPTIVVFVDGKFIKKYENIGAKTGIEILKYYVKVSNSK